MQYLRNILSIKSVRLFLWILLTIIILNLAINTAFGANTIQTDATLNGAETSIRVWGQIDSWAECDADETVAMGSNIYLQPQIVLENYQDFNGQFVNPIGNEIALGDYFDVTFTLNNLYEYPFDGVGIPLTGLETDQNVLYVSIQGMEENGFGGYQIRRDCMFLLGTWSETVFTLLAGVEIVPFDFFGDTFNTTVVNSVTGGVQETTQPLVPVAGAMVGVPLAFLIGRRIVTLIRVMV